MWGKAGPTSLSARPEKSLRLKNIQANASKAAYRRPARMDFDLNK